MESMTFRKLKRDIVISICADGRELVGIYFADTDGKGILLEANPDTADKIIELWNEEVELNEENL